MWQGRNPDVLAPLSCCVQNDNGHAYPPTVNDFSSSCLYNGTSPFDYYQPVGTCYEYTPWSVEKLTLYNKKFISTISAAKYKTQNTQRNRQN